MAKKQNQDTTAAMKALTLYSLLIFSGRRYSLTELGALLECSKATVMRLIAQIESNHTLHVQINTEVQKRQRYYWAMRPDQKPNVSLEARAIQDLVLCRDMLANLLPPRLRGEIEATINQTTVLLDDYDKRDAALTSVAMAASKGAVDYSAHQDIIRTVLDGLRRQRIVALEYRAHDRQEAKAFAVAPLQLVTHRDSLYLRARREQDLGKKKGFYDPTLAVHRIVSARVTRRAFTPPKQTAKDRYSVFGFMPGKRFTVLVRAEPRVAPYLRERIWSHDQRFTDLDGGGVQLKFSAGSEDEVVSWVLGFSGQLALIEPARLRERIAECAGLIHTGHGG